MSKFYLNSKFRLNIIGNCAANFLLFDGTRINRRRSRPDDKDSEDMKNWLQHCTARK